MIDRDNLCTNLAPRPTQTASENHRAEIGDKEEQRAGSNPPVHGKRSAGNDCIVGKGGINGPNQPRQQHDAKQQNNRDTRWTFQSLFPQGITAYPLPIPANPAADG